MLAIADESTGARSMAAGIIVMRCGRRRADALITTGSVQRRVCKAVRSGFRIPVGEIEEADLAVRSARFVMMDSVFLYLSGITTIAGLGMLLRKRTRRAGARVAAAGVGGMVGGVLLAAAEKRATGKAPLHNGMPG